VEQTKRSSVIYKKLGHCWRCTLLTSTDLTLFTLIKSDLKILRVFKDSKYSVIEGENLLLFVVVKSINWRVEGCMVRWLS